MILVRPWPAYASYCLHLSVLSLERDQMATPLDANQRIWRVWKNMSVVRGTWELSDDQLYTWREAQAAIVLLHQGNLFIRAQAFREGENPNGQATTKSA